MTDAVVHPEGRICTKCGEWKPAAFFLLDRRRIGLKAELRAHCRDCTYAENKARRDANLGKYKHMESESRKRHSDRVLDWSRFYNLRIRYGLSKEQAIALFEKHNNACAVCLRPLLFRAHGRGRPDSACVDHDHSTGKARGILCHRCNTAIGLFEDDPGIIEKASAYLRASR